MADFFDYLEWRGDITLEEIPLTSVDMLLLSQITYANLEGLISESFCEVQTLSTLAKAFKAAPDYEKRLNTGVLINKRTAELLLKAGKSKRFKNISVCGLESILSEKNTEQFAAVVFKAGSETILSYRGTDDTVIGWWEDFNLACMDEIPAQVDAIKYFDKVIENFDGNITIIGHSKGGNLAVNTSVKCGLEKQKRISAIYNFDGPGFYKEFYEQEAYKNIEKRLYSFYPQFSVVGMVFEHPEKYKILKSNGFAIMEHDAMTWQLMGRDFTTIKTFDEPSVIFHTAFNEWVYGLSITERKKFVDALFNIISASGAKTLSEIDNSAITSSAKMLSAFSALDKNTKKEIRRIIGLFMDSLHSEFPWIRIFELKK